VEDFAIKVEKVSKVFKLPREKNSSIKSAFVNFYKSKKGYELQKALNNVSFEIKKGEFFGIVGRNGSGKSTMLKLLAGIYTPSKGEVHVRGSLTPFIELGVGFNPELTGRENVFLNGSLLGFNRREMKLMYNDIVEFAELERFMDQKLKNYSSGMQVRLAFSIAIRAQSDILLIDEVLAVGDSAFQRKCFDYFEDIKKSGKTIVLVSHDMDSIKRFCTRAALISNGRLELIGSPAQVADLYEKQNASDKKLSDRDEWYINRGTIIKTIELNNDKAKFSSDEKIQIKLLINSDSERIVFPGLNIFKDGQLVSGATPQFQMEPIMISKDSSITYTYEFTTKSLTQGDYLVDGIVYESGKDTPIFYRSQMLNFYVSSLEGGWGSNNLNGKWSASNPSGDDD